MMKYTRLSVLFFFTMFVGLSCVDQDFDEPPSKGLSELEANTTIAELKAMHRNGVIIELTDDIIISGRVISDDAEGNFFKNMIIQDATGGIEMRINQNQLQAVYQRNRIVFVKCNGLSIGDYNNFIQLGLGDDGSGGLGRIPETLIGEFVEIGELPAQPVEPTEVLISNITPDMYGTLIKLIDVEFSRDDFNQTYADPNGTSGTNRTIEDCLGGEITIRTSDFCDFAGDITPFGNGTVVGVASVFGSTGQILIRDVADVDMPKTPCNRSGEPATQINIADLRAIFTGSPTTAPDAKYIQGVVISDRSTQNIVDQNIVVQDATGGIVIRFASNHSLPMGEEVQVDVSGLELSEYQGWLQVTGVPSGREMRLGTGAMPTPVEITISELQADFESYESTLVQIKEAEFASAGTYSGGVDVNDATGTMLMFTRFAATFASDFLPTGMVTITAIVSQGGTTEAQQISIRNVDDVTGGTTGSGGDPVDELTEDFEGQTDFQAVAIRNWENLALTGNRNWQAKEFGGNLYAQGTAFRDMDPEVDAWLITPKLNMDVITTLEFESAMAFWIHDGMTVYISTNYDGNNVGIATWTDLQPRIAMESDGDNTWVPSGEVDLSAYDGIAHIAFVYKGTSAMNTSSYRVDNIEIK